MWPRVRRRLQQPLPTVLCTCGEFMQHADCEHVVYVKALENFQGAENLNNIPVLRPKGRKRKAEAALPAPVYILDILDADFVFFSLPPQGPTLTSWEGSDRTEMKEAFSQGLEATGEGTLARGMTREEGVLLLERMDELADAMVVVVDRNDVPTSRQKSSKPAPTAGPICRRVQLDLPCGSTVGVAVWEHATGCLDVVDQTGRFLPSVPSEKIASASRRAHVEVLDTAAVDGCTEQSLRGWLADPGTAHEPCEALLSPYTGPATATRVQGIGKREVMVKALPGSLPLELSVLGLTSGVDTKASGQASGSFEWQFAGDSGWCNFEPAASRLLEAAQQRSLDTLSGRVLTGTCFSAYCKLPFLQAMAGSATHTPTLRERLLSETVDTADLGELQGLGSRATSFYERSLAQRTFAPLTAGGIRSSIFVLVQTAMGGGVLTIAFMLRISGPFMGVFLLLAGMLVAFVSMDVLMKSAVLLHRYTFGSLLSYAFGPRSGVFLDLMLFLYGNGSLLTYFIFLGDFIPSIYLYFTGLTGTPVADRYSPEYAELRAHCLVAMFLLVFPVSLFRDLSAFKALSPIMLVAIGYTEILVLVTCVFSFHFDGWDWWQHLRRLQIHGPSLEASFSDFADVSRAFSISVFAYCCHLSLRCGF
eukprot:s2075_g2.t1